MISKFRWLAVASLALAPVFAAPPTITSGGIVNAASYQPGVAPGALVSIFGSDLAATTAVVDSSDFVNGSLPTTFRGTSVTIDGKPAYLRYVSPGQINVQAPASTATGPVRVTVTTADGSITVNAICSTIMPAIYGSGSFVSAIRANDGAAVGGAAARPGDLLSIYVNGLGATASGVQPGAAFSGADPVVDSTTVSVGGVDAAVSFSGLIGPGLYLVTFTVPSSLATGSYPVVVTQSGVSSPPLPLLNVATSAADTAVALSASASILSSGAAVTLTATVTPSSSSGTVTFWEGPIPIGTATLSAGAASFSTALSTGDHAIRAVFGSGDTAVSSVAVPVSISAPSDCSAVSGTPRVVCLANTFLATLSSSEKSAVQYAFDLASVTRWTNLPVGLVSRNGLRFGDLSSVQLSAAQSLVQAALSAEGVDRMQEIRGADEVIAPVNAMFRWGAANYYIVFYGTPSVSAPWMLQISGHHYALNHTFNSKYISGSPFFLGTEPPVYTLQGAKYSPQDKQRAAMFALNQTLLANSAAKLSGTFDDVVVGPDQGGGGPGGGGGSVNFPRSYPTGTTGRGVLASELSAAQQALVQKAIEAWVGDLDAVTASELLSLYQESGALNATYVGYSGSGSMTTVGDYIRIDGPRVWIELVVQSGIAIRNSYHYHSIWRDKIADYGGEFNQ